MHRLSKISASFTSKKNDSIDSSGDKSSKRFSRPNILQLSPHKEGSTGDVNENDKHDEWYEMMTAVTTSPIDEISQNVQKMNNETNDTPRKASNGLDQMHLEPDNAAEIEALEQSLTALVDDFRSGRMCALSEEKLKMMRKARKEMEDLTAFHVKLHKMQAPNLSACRYDMSFCSTDVKEEDRMSNIYADGKDV
ncbi:hypothetical protein DINM_003570 [Dirofilaria immitis]|nr:hypothetical protein [Dirofilaria immitis]